MRTDGECDSKLAWSRKSSMMEVPKVPSPEGHVFPPGETAQRRPELQTSLMQGKWWPRIERPYRDQMGERDGRVMHREEIPSRMILDTFRGKLLQGVRACGSDDATVSAVDKLILKLESEGALGVMMTGSMYIDTETIRCIFHVGQLAQLKATKADWWSLFSDAIGDAVAKAKSLGYNIAVGRLMIPVEDCCEIPLVIHFTDAGQIQEIIRIKLQDRILMGNEEFLVPIVTQLIEYMFGSDNIYKYRMLTTDAGISGGPTTRSSLKQVRKDTGLSPVAVQQSLMDEKAQRALHVNPTTYTDTGIVSQSLLDTSEYRSIPIEEVTKHLAGLSLHEDPEPTGVKFRRETPQKRRSLGTSMFHGGVSQRYSSTPRVYEEESKRYCPDKTRYPDLAEEASYSNQNDSGSKQVKVTKSPQDEVPKTHASGATLFPIIEYEHEQEVETIPLSEQDAIFNQRWLEKHPDEGTQFELSCIKENINWKTTLFHTLRTETEVLKTLPSFIRSHERKDVAESLVRNIIQHLRWEDGEQIIRAGRYLRQLAYEQLSIEDEVEELEWDLIMQEGIRQSYLESVHPLRSQHVSLPPMRSENVERMTRELMERRDRSLSDPAMYRLPQSNNEDQTQIKGASGGVDKSRTPSRQNTKTQRENTTIRQTEKKHDEQSSASNNKPVETDLSIYGRLHKAQTNGYASRGNSPANGTLQRFANADEKEKLSNVRIRNLRESDEESQEPDSENEEENSNSPQNELNEEQMLDPLFRADAEKGRRLEVESELRKCVAELDYKQRELETREKEKNSIIQALTRSRDEMFQLQQEGRQVDAQLMGERTKYSQKLQEKETLLNQLQRDKERIETRYDDLFDAAEEAIQKENARANKLVETLHRREAVRQTLAQSLPAPVVQPPAKSRYSQSLYAPGSNDPEKVRSDDKPTREPFGNEYLTRMITEGRRSDGTLRTSTYPNASQGQLYRNGIGRSELVPREPGNSQGYQSKNSTFIIPGSTTQPQRMDNIPLLDCMAAMTGATEYTPGNTVEAMKNLPTYDGEMGDDRSDIGHEPSREPEYPAFDPHGRKMPSKIDLKWLRYEMNHKSDRELRIKQIPEFKESTPEMYWENWRTFFLSEARQLGLNALEQRRIIADKCKGKAAQVVAKVKEESDRTGIEYTAELLLEELTDEFFDNAVQLELEQEVHSSKQDVEREDPETLYEFCDRMYKNCQRLHSGDWAAADKEWLGSMNRGINSRRELKDYITKNHNEGKTPRQIIKILRDLGEHVKPGTKVSQIEKSKPAAKQLIAVTPSLANSGTGGRGFSSLMYFSEVTFHDEYIDPNLVEGCAQVIYHLWDRDGEAVEADDIVQVLLAQRPFARIAPNEWVWNLKNAVGDLLTNRLRELHKTNPIPMIDQWNSTKFRGFLTWFTVIMRQVIGAFDRIGDLNSRNNERRRELTETRRGGFTSWGQNQSTTNQKEALTRQERRPNKPQGGGRGGRGGRGGARQGGQRGGQRRQFDQSSQQEKRQDAPVKSPQNDPTKTVAMCLLCRVNTVCDRTCADGAKHYCADCYNEPLWRELTTGAGPQQKNCVLCLTKATNSDELQVFLADLIRSSHF